MKHLNENFYIKNKKRNYIQNLGIEQIIDKAKAIQNDLLEFINEDSEIEEFTHKLETYQLLNNRYEFKNFLYMILNISKNHYRQNSFFTRIEQIIQFYKSEIQQNFSNFELFHIFQSNNRLLLFLIEHQILYIDKTIFNIFNEEIKYREYFLPELNQYSKEKGQENIEINDQIYDTSFYDYRKNGENEDYICQMIRNDSVIEFIQYTNKKNFPLKYKIKPSILETNSFLINRTPTMIEYSAFFGSFQIFQYLFKNEVEVDSNLWLYAIHGKNPEIIHFLEEIEIEPNIKCIKESIKCNHNEITDYLFDNYPDKFHRNEIDINSGIKYYNFNYFPTKMDIDLAFFYFCKFDNYYLVDYLLKTESQLNINYKKMIKKSYFFYGNQNFLYPIGVAAKNMNLDIFSLLLDQKNITIDEFCFYNCDKLEKISIPSSIQTIKSHTFDGCFSLTEIIIPNSVTSIESYAFNNCKLLIKIIIPNSVTLIGKGAFNKCRSLIEIIIPNSVKTIEENAFCECSSLTQITIPSSIIEINAKTFSKCTSLSQISIPFTIKRIEHDAFEECSSLQHIIYTNRSSNNLCLFGCSLLPHFTYYKLNYLHVPILLGESKNINFNKGFNENKTFSLCLSRPITQSTNNKNLTFYKCESLPQVSIPPFIKINKDIEDEDMKSRASMNISDKFFKSLEILPNIRIWDFFNIGTSKKFLSTKSHSIEINSFGNCSSLLEIEIPFSITSINDWSFSECSSLTTVIIPPSVKSIGNYVFYGCSSLKQITIPSSIEIIGKETFFKCSSLTEIIIPSSVTNIETGAFKKCSSLEKITFESSSSLKIIDSYAFCKCSALKELIIPPSVSSIGRGAFSGCSSLNKITIPSSIQQIQPFTFNGCSSLEEINLPHLLKSIEKCSFKNCKSLKNIIIPSSVEYIYDYSFYGCQELTEVIILSSLTRIDEFSLPQNSLIIQFIQET